MLQCPSLHFTPLHYTSRHFTSSHLNFTQLHFTTLSFGLTPFKFPTAPLHLTLPHFNSLHFTALLDDFRYTLLLSYHPFYNCFPNSVSKNLRLQGNVPNASSGSWFQFLMVLFTREYFPIFRSLFPVPNFPNMINLIQMYFKELYSIVRVRVSYCFLRTKNERAETNSDVILELVSMQHTVPTFILSELVEIVPLMSRLATLLNVWLPTAMKNLFEPSTEWYLDPAYT